MEGRKWSLVLFVTLACGVFTFMNVYSVQAKPINLSFSELFPAVHMHAKLIDSFAKDIEERTNGQVKITHYPGGALLKGPQIYQGIVKGITDMGMSVLGYSRGRFPVMEAIVLPMGYPNVAESGL